jgi:hypothetical protein
MSSRQAVVLASRVVCVFLIFWVVVNVVDLPYDLLGLHRYWNWNALAAGSDLGLYRYEFLSYSLRVDAAILRIALELFFAGVFYRCGPLISRFFTVGAMSPEASD